jgi:hypothetical protein
MVSAVISPSLATKVLVGGTIYEPACTAKSGVYFWNGSGAQRAASADAEQSRACIFQTQKFILSLLTKIGKFLVTFV